MNISQKSNPTYRRVQNSDLSSTTYGDHIEDVAEVVPSAVDVATGGFRSTSWIFIFILITVLSTVLCACIGVRYIQGGYYGTAAASYTNEREEDKHHVKRVDGSTLDTPEVFSKTNRMFSSEKGGTPGSSGRKSGRRRMTAREKRAALNARNAPRLHGNNTEDTMEDFEILSAASAASSTEETPEDVQTSNPMFKDRKHAPRLSMLDFGKTLDEGEGDDSEAAAEFWRRRNRTGDDDS